MHSKKEYKVIAIYGSPRRGGNTDILLNRFLDGLEEHKIKSGKNITVERIFVSSLKISPCRECGHCLETGECATQDDMQSIYPRIIDSDFIAVASPIFFTTVPGYLKAFIDRFQRFWVLKYEFKKRIIKKDKNGILISVSGSGIKDIFKCTKKVIGALFDVLYTKYHRDFLYNSIDSKGDILKNKGALEAVYNFGMNCDFLE